VPERVVNVETLRWHASRNYEGMGAGRYSPGAAAMLMRSTVSYSLLDDPARGDCSCGVAAMLLAAPGETRWSHA
jgi:hypothetical protein